MTGWAPPGRRTPFTLAAVGLFLAISAGAQGIEQKPIVGYADRLSVAQGETIRFMVSSHLPRYRADLVRLVHGDANPTGPGLKEVVVDSTFNRAHAGRRQELDAGSHVLVGDHPALRLSGDFTLQAWIAPTTPGKGRQGLVTKFSAEGRRGYGLFLAEDGSLALRIGDPEGSVEEVRSETPLRAWVPASSFRGLNQGVNPPSWYFVAATFDASLGRVTLYQEPDPFWPGDASRAVVERSVALRSVGENEAPLVMAGYQAPPAGGRATIDGHFNGRIQNPRVFDRALSRPEVEALRDGAEPGAPVAAWDFSRDIGSRNVHDTSSHRLHGRTVQMPTRGVTGQGWTGEANHFDQAPGQFAAIHFHDDDLDDAGWEVDFEYAVPESLPSGVYAARLRAGEADDYISFFVRPGPGADHAPIAFLAPTFTYLAYGNWKRGTPELLSLYSHHSDGSGVSYASGLRPILEMRPGVVHHDISSEVVTGPHGFNADLHLVDWLETKGYSFDVVTDGDLHSEGAALLRPYRVVITGSHPEYWSGPMLDGLESYLRAGGRLMYLGGNGFYWVTSVDPENGHTIEIRRRAGTEAWQAAPGEYHHSTTGELGGLWRFRGRPPQELVGTGFTAQGGGRGRPYERAPDGLDPRAAFVFEGIGPDEPIGDFPCLVMEHGAAGLEFDRLDHVLGTPPHALLLATATGFSALYDHVVEEVLVADSKQSGPVNARVRADIVLFEYPGGGAVFSTSSITWDSCLSYNDYENNVSRMTENVLNRFQAEPSPLEAVQGP